MQLHVAEPDPFETDDWLSAWYLQMGRTGADVEIFRYAGAGHLYTDPGLPDYDEEAAEATWRVALGFLDELGGLKPRGVYVRSTCWVPDRVRYERAQDGGRVRLGLVGDDVVVHLRPLGGDVQDAVAVAVHVEPVHVPVGGLDDRRGERGDRVRGDVQEVVEVVGGHRGDHELRRGRGRQRVGRGVQRHVVGPRHVDVAGQEHGVVDGVRRAGGRAARGGRPCSRPTGRC